MCTGAVFATTYTSTWYNEDGTVYDTSTCQSGGDITLPTAPTKYGYTFIGWEKAYTRIAYLESTGTQHIDIPIGTNSGIYIKADIEYTEVTDWAVAIQNRDNVSSPLFLNQIDADKNWYIYFNKIIYQTSQSVSEDVKYHVEINLIPGNSEYIVNNMQVASSYINYTIGDYIGLFSTLHATKGIINQAKVKFYGFQVFNINYTLIRDMIPVLDYADVPCMYDKVTGQFFYNSGTGSFIAGPVL